MIENKESDVLYTSAKWFKIAQPQVFSTYSKITKRIKRAMQSNEIIYPDHQNIFRALELTPSHKVKVVIIGQDPYHTGAANGLAFSVQPGVKFPPSLQNIFKELSDDLGYTAPASGDLSPWAEQGVLLLNTVLTVYKGRPNSCADWGWQDITSDVIRTCLLLPQPVVFIAWGRQARIFLKNIMNDIRVLNNKAFIYSSHPSPLGAYKSTKDAPAFIGSKPFSTANKLLINMGSEPVNWKL